MESTIDARKAEGRSSHAKTNLALLVVLLALLAAMWAAGPAFGAHLNDTNGVEDTRPFPSVFEGRSFIGVYTGATGYSSATREGAAGWSAQNIRADYGIVSNSSSANIYARDISTCGDGYEAIYSNRIPGLDYITYDPCYMNGHALADRTYMEHYYWEDVVTAKHELGHGAGVGDHNGYDGAYQNIITWYCPIDCSNVSAITSHDVYDSNRAP